MKNGSQLACVTGPVKTVLLGRAQSVDVLIAIVRFSLQAKNARGVVVNSPRARLEICKCRVTVWDERVAALHNTGRRNHRNIETGKRFAGNGNPVTHNFSKTEVGADRRYCPHRQAFSSQLEFTKSSASSYPRRWFGESILRQSNAELCRGIAYSGGHSTKLIWTSGRGCTSRASSKVKGRQSWASCCAVASWLGESLPANMSRNACAGRGVLDR